MDWDPNFLHRSPMLESLRAHAPAFGGGWPEIDELQRFLDRREPGVCNAAGMPLRLVVQGRRPGRLEERYEARVFLKAELQVRERNWHDLFNVLAWAAFPRAKAALNTRHYAALQAQQAAGLRNRGAAQDALTLFDEGGVIVASSDDVLADRLSGWRWKELFWTRRPQLLARMRFLLFGHALGEKALRPFRGITGRGIVLDVEPSLLEVPLRDRLSLLDAMLAERLSDPAVLSGTRALAVVPVLGVPGWCAENERESYYDDTDYFRPGRLPKNRGS